MADERVTVKVKASTYSDGSSVEMRVDVVAAKGWQGGVTAPPVGLVTAAIDGARKAATDAVKAVRA